MDRPALVVRGALRHLFASRLAYALGLLGFVVLGAGVVVGPVGAALGIATVGGLLGLRGWLRRRVLVVEGEGEGAVLRHGPDARLATSLAGAAGGIVHRTAGATYRGIRTGADLEELLVVRHDGTTLAHVVGRGFAARDLAAVRDAIGGVWLPSDVARGRGTMPADAPWHLRHPRGATAVSIAAGLATLVVLLAAFVALTRIGSDAFVWPWWR